MLYPLSYGGGDLWTDVLGARGGTVLGKILRAPTDSAPRTV